MKIILVKNLEIPDLKVIRFARFNDERGYFTEPFRRSDIKQSPDTQFLHGLEFLQKNESYSVAGVVRGLHFQWDPPMGKLVRTVSGRMVDMAMDIRKTSPSFGKIVLYEMKSNPHAEYDEWIWIPAGFAHGNYFTEPSVIEYFCTAEYNAKTESGISPMSSDIDWTLAEARLRDEFRMLARNAIISDKDRKAQNLADWSANGNSKIFQYGE